ncbi:uncharacterized protein LOC18446957 [Amborella trichopoda]|uniref:uncharacterized protein LOC18446957 n=1 Tax=Amborella trichopoda TaxID=13333 RepID=UPI0005D40ADD|nr:uncharacterized protein LOC18446957 [Amborella trichopoda]|eukprot:XP_011628032.1 uncharacterized protein LOC18446957 [Amborella trichopoda]
MLSQKSYSFMAVGLLSLSTNPKSLHSYISPFNGWRSNSRPRPLKEVGRRGFLSLLLTPTVVFSETNSSKNALLQKYLKKSEENKARNDKERLDSYYKRNYKDYFELFEGPIKDKKEGLSEVEKGIQEWLKANK